MIERNVSCLKKKFNKIHDEISLTKSPKSSTTARNPSCRKHESRASGTAQARNEKKSNKNSLLLFDYDRCAVPHALCSYSLPDRSLAIVEFDKNALLLFDYEKHASNLQKEEKTVTDKKSKKFNDTKKTIWQKI